ncbi:hypothetical protein RDWZM_010139 [Blomia tropicalis]|uniref:Uncharacterized protein n=1 Tax=Blomia tropicalis TaxID=40697 RepID=A0A9Q0LY68_BLOTA|nr:hypothetical protein RDWZM_010139 [Blomia tropicalis]
MAFSNTDQGFKIQIRHLEKNVNATVEQVKKYREEVVRRMEKATDGERLWSKYVKCLDLLRATLEARDELSDVEEELIQFDVVFGGPRNSTMVNDGQRDNNMENEVRAVRGNPNNEGCNGNNGSELHGLTVSRSSRRSSMESRVESFIPSEDDGICIKNDIKEGRVIVGLDQLYMYLKPGKRILETICGDYCFEKRQFISRMGRVPSIEQDEPEEVHEKEMKVQ